MRPYWLEARNAFLGSLLGFICGLPAWVILSMWFGGDIVRTVGIVACIWFGITVWIVVVYVWQMHHAIKRLFSARRRRRELLRSEFSEHETSVH
jgi:hypothetical protein